ncbi:hypothetical protein [Aliarcobacter butzleri]|uniref:hypothetical protein n=1 Tax=Aliarcobacter butzleri TaxID=28197 RepID=UPI003AF7138B
MEHELYTITTHPNYFKFDDPEINIKGFWIKTTDFAVLTSKSKQVIISKCINNSLPSNVIFELTTNSSANYFFISLESLPYTTDQAKIFRLELLTSPQSKSLNLDIVELEDENGKKIPQFHNSNLKVNGYWLPTDEYARLICVGKGTLIRRTQENQLHLGTIYKQGVGSVPNLYFVNLSAPAYTPEQAELFLLKYNLNQMQKKIDELSDLPKWSEIKTFSKFLNENKGLPEALISLSSLKTSDILKMIEFNKKLMKLFPEG